jgi:hypothetical protein
VAGRRVEDEESIVRARIWLGVWVVVTAIVGGTAAKASDTAEGARILMESMQADRKLLGVLATSTTELLDKVMDTIKTCNRIKKLQDKAACFNRLERSADVAFTDLKSELSDIQALAKRPL